LVGREDCADVLLWFSRSASELRKSTGYAEMQFSRELKQNDHIAFSAHIE